MPPDNWNTHRASFDGTVQSTAPEPHITDTSPVVTRPILQEDPGTGGSSTYIGRHHLGDNAIDETSARDYGQSRQQGLSDLEQKTLELWDVFALPPRPLHESLLESFMQYCFPWMPLLEPSEAHVRDNQQSSLLLSQAIFLAASRVNPSPPVCEYASPAEFYQRAKALFWIGHEKNELTVIKATTMLHWYTPDGPAFVSHDTSEYWLKIGVGLAYQIGLHKEPPPGPQRAIRRRMWWSLVVSLATSGVILVVTNNRRCEILSSLFREVDLELSIWKTRTYRCRPWMISQTHQKLESYLLLMSKFAAF
jgi:hypothetical protein